MLISAWNRRLASPLTLLTALSLSGCLAAPSTTSGPIRSESSAEADDDLPLGDRPEDDKADGDWGSALDCKPIPDLPQLVAPRITISIDGLTVHVVDPATGYDKVFPAGVGQIETNENDAAFGESKSYYPVIATGRQDFAINPSTVNACRTWWTDPDTHEKSPVFAGLPFMPFYGGYALHGPIDSYRAKNGGSLRRGYVSHGCIRMQAADIAELYGRMKKLTKVPVRLQREPERLENGTRVDLVTRWIGAECQADTDCNYPGGFCHANPYGGRGFCSAPCTRSCADRAGAPTTFCVPDPLDSGKGMCVSRTNAQNSDCRAFGQMRPRTLSRPDRSATAEVCMPGSRGSLGDPCLASSDCGNGGACYGATADRYGYCSDACVLTCPDEPGFAMTACTADPVTGSGLARGCARSCTVESNGSECQGDTTCVRRDPTNPKDRRFICRRPS